MTTSQLHVVFGTGPLGRSVANELVRRGKSVRVVSRSGQMAEAPAGVELRSGDLYNPSVVRELTQGAAVAYQCAQPHYWEWPQKFPPLQAAIIEGLTGSGVKLVFGENTYMYGDTNGKPLTEDLPYAAHTRKGQVRAAMSEAALAAHKAGKVPVTMGRGSDFFGPWALGSSHGDRVFYPALAGKAASFAGKLNIPHTATYIEDFGRALVILGERDEALGRAWHVPSARPPRPQRQFAEFGRRNQDFLDRDTQVLGASTDTHYVHLAWRQNHADLKSLPFPMLADTKKELSTALGILHKDAGVALRATFIVDPDGIIRWASANDLSVGRSVDEVVRVLDALQTDELCPCNWTKGGETLGKAA